MVRMVLALLLGLGVAAVPVAAEAPPENVDIDVAFDADAPPVGPSVLFASPDAPVRIVRRFAVDDEADAAERAWIGVHVVAVPKALASQLKLEAQGLMVINVAEDAPADKAGIQRYDVVVRFNGRTVPAARSEFVGMIQKVGVGKKVAIEVVRQGKPVTIEFELAAAPKTPHVEFKYEDEPDVIGQDELRIRGRMLFKGPGGDWLLKDFGELPNLPQPLVQALPQMRDSDITFFPGREGGMEIHIVVEQDGRRTEIHRRADGKIEVTKSKKTDDTETTNTNVYKDERELRKADPEAHQLLKNTRGKVGGGAFAFQFPFNVARPFRSEVKRWSVDVEKKLEEAHQQLADAQKKLAEQLARPHRRIEVKRLHRIGESERPRDGIRFTTDDQGRIEARIRKGDDELTMSFKNAEAMAERRPALFEKYEKLRSDLEN